MSEEIFGRHEAEILAQVHAIRASKNKSRKRFQPVPLLYEKGDRKPLAEVLQTNHGLVVAYWAPSYEMNIKDEGYTPFRRNSVQDLDPITGPDQRFVMQGRHGRYRLTGRDLITQSFTFQNGNRLTFGRAVTR